MCHCTCLASVSLPTVCDPTMVRLHIHTRAIKAMFTRDGLPECGTYLVALRTVNIVSFSGLDVFITRVRTHWPV